MRRDHHLPERCEPVGGTAVEGKRAKLAGERVKSAAFVASPPDRTGIAVHDGHEGTEVRGARGGGRRRFRG